MEAEFIIHVVHVHTVNSTIPGCIFKGSNFEATLKIHKKSNLIGIWSFFLHNIQCKNTCVSEIIIKMENSLVVIFGEICPETMYYSTGSLARFLSNFKNS